MITFIWIYVEKNPNWNHKKANKYPIKHVRSFHRVVRYIAILNNKLIIYFFLFLIKKTFFTILQSLELYFRDHFFMEEWSKLLFIVIDTEERRI